MSKVLTYQSVYDPVDEDRFEISAWNDPLVKDSKFDAKSGEQTDAVAVECWFTIKDPLVFDLSKVAAADWGYMLLEAARESLFPEEPKYGQIVYNRAVELPEQRLAQRESHADLKVTFVFEATLQRNS